MTQPRQRRPRADARRNRDRLLAEADAVFRQEGTGAPLESVARRAGVAIGTLYGHFPNRRALIGSLLRERNEALFEYGQVLRTSSAPRQALTRWVHAVVEHAAAYQGLAAVFADWLDDPDSELHSSCVRMNDISDALIVTPERTAPSAGT